MFDEVADTYADSLRRNHRFIPGSINWYSEYKVRITSKLISSSPKKILDFGCGIGLSVPHLHHFFPSSEIFAEDTSVNSIDIALKGFSFLQFGKNVSGFDLIFIAGVFHHIPSSDRGLVLQQLTSRLNPGGRMIIFEHNPFNPITRRLVSTCEFDQDAELISKASMIKLLQRSAELRLIKNQYCLYFPPLFRFLSFFERFLSLIPLGGQYFVLVKKLD